jgi:hypothetical protein
MNAAIEGKIRTDQTLRTFDEAEAFVRRIIPAAATVWIERLGAPLFDVTTYGEALPAYAYGPTEIDFKTGIKDY